MRLIDLLSERFATSSAFAFLISVSLKSADASLSLLSFQTWMSQIFFKHSLKLIFFRDGRIIRKGLDMSLSQSHDPVVLPNVKARNPDWHLTVPFSFISWKPISGGSLSRA
jgi:hypothetical protein